MVACRNLLVTLLADCEYKQAMGSFTRVCLSNPERSSRLIAYNHKINQACDLFKMVEQTLCRSVTWNAAMLGIATTGPEPAVYQFAKKVLRLDAVCCFWMAACSTHIGVDFCSYGFLRFHTSGSKVITLIPIDNVRKMMSRNGKAEQTHSTITSYVGMVTGAELQELLQSEHVKQAVVSSGDLLICPAGFLLIEKTLSQPSWGLRRLLLPDSEEEVGEVQSWLNLKGDIDMEEQQKFLNLCARVLPKKKKK